MAWLVHERHAWVGGSPRRARRVWRGPSEPSPGPVRLRRPPSAVAELGVLTDRPEAELATLLDRASLVARLTPGQCGDEAACAAVRSALQDEHTTTLQVVAGRRLEPRRDRPRRKRRGAAAARPRERHEARARRRRAGRRGAVAPPDRDTRSVRCRCRHRREGGRPRLRPAPRPHRDPARLRGPRGDRAARRVCVPKGPRSSCSTSRRRRASCGS